MDRTLENDNFAENINNNGQEENKQTGMDNRQAVEGSAISGTLAEPEKRDGISRTVASTNLAGNTNNVYDAEELEELESRGINPYWDKTKLRKELKNQAQQNGVWLENSYLDDKVLIHDQKRTGTSENDVYKNPDGKTLTKVNNLAYVNGAERSNNLNSIIDRLNSHNELFPNVTYTIKGFMDNKDGYPSLVLEQMEINAERNATQEEIDEHLTKAGFKKDGIREWSNGHEVWGNGKYELFDARPANVLMGKDGNLYFVDTVPHSVAYINQGYNIQTQGIEISEPISDSIEDEQQVSEQKPLTHS
ncbi:MAG: hypothetical protein LBL24_01325 [Bacteroidales bacterium]|nr:hypothetical protein [Bacteroidales bacterium]